jgi:hypothetical protein
MPRIEQRLKNLEMRIPPRCPSCSQVVECSACNGWKDDARHFGIDPEWLISVVRAAIDSQISGNPYDFFLPPTYNTNRLTVEEIKQLHALLTKAKGTIHETICQTYEN